jgi:integrase/recombinase XerD
MRRKPRKPVPRHYAGDPSIRGGFRSYLIEFIEWTEAMNFSASLIKNRRVEMGYFIDWCEARSITTPHDVTRAILESYRQHVFAYRKPRDGLPLCFETQGRHLLSVRSFFKWMTRQHHLLFNPASELDLPKHEKRLPRHVLTVAEIAQILNVPDTGAANGMGIRDRAIMETLYSTGMRRAELVNLDLTDLDIERGTVLIRQGKGKKDRMVPIGERASAWVARYVEEVRPRYVDEANEQVLFISTSYARMGGTAMSALVKKAIDGANLERVKQSGPLKSSCHLFRHACATHMLEGGADIRYIQALLGHANLQATEVYTRVAILQLKAVHERTHPARMERRNDAERAPVDTSRAAPADAARKTLLAALEAEQEAEQEAEAD